MGSACPISPKFAKFPPKFVKICQISGNIRQNLPNFVLQKGSRQEIPTVLEGHTHRVTTPENPVTRAEPRSGETTQNPRRDPADPYERPSPLRGKFPRRASRRVVPIVEEINPNLPIFRDGLAQTQPQP